MRPASGLDVLFLDFNSYFASVEQQDNPRLRGRPVVVSPLDTEVTCAIAASYEARAHGIRTGTKIYEARRLCPGLVVVPARHEVYVAYHHRLMDEIQNHVPIHKVHSIDEVACKLIGAERTPDNAVALARRIKAGIAANVGASLRSSIGFAPTTLLAKLAAELHKPDGLTLLPLETLPGAIAHLDLADIPGIGRNMAARLHAAGVHGVAALWGLAPKQARALWGSVTGERFWYALHGYDVPDQPTEKRAIGHSRVLPVELRPPHLAKLVARALLLKAARRLRRYERAAGCLSLSVRAAGSQRLDSAASFAPTQDSFRLLDELDRLWARLHLADSRAPRLKMVTIYLTGLVGQQRRQGDLFDAAGAAHRAGIPAERREQIWHALDGLQSRYGRNSVALASQLAIDLKYLGAKIAFTRIPETREFDD